MPRSKSLSFGICLLGCTAIASGQATSPSLRVRSIAEVESRALEDDQRITRLVPAERVVPGDWVIYSVEIRNVGPIAILTPVVVEPIPAHMAYVANSATGPGAQISFSIDGGRTFDRPEKLRTWGPDHGWQLADPTTYTHIRWELKNSLKSNSVAFARFRAVVK